MRTDELYRTDLNFRLWGITTPELLTKIKGSNCGCCGNWVQGDAGDTGYRPDWRWTLCNSCIEQGKAYSKIHPFRMSRFEKLRWKYFNWRDKIHMYLAHDWGNGQQILAQR